MATDKSRREAERRRLQRQADRRRAQSSNRKRTNLIISIVGALVLVAGLITLLVVTNGDDDTQPAAAGQCQWTKDGTAAKKATVPSTVNPPTTGTVAVAVRTTQGNLGFTLDRTNAPCAVASFLSLAGQKFFDATACHRLTTGPSLYVLQCGDPTGSGSGGPGYKFEDELTGNETYPAGTLAMANAGPDTNGSQFFVVYKDSQLGADYTVFGKVTTGLDVVTKVAAAGATGGGADGKPALPITLSTVTAAK